MFNTPPVVPIYAALQTLRWIKAKGGVKEMERRAIEKANLLYDEIDRNKLFVGTASKEDRSLMNICFVMNEKYPKEFLQRFHRRPVVPSNFSRRKKSRRQKWGFVYKIRF